MKKKRCKMCSRMRPLRRMEHGPTGWSWDWSCTSLSSCERAFFDLYARVNRQSCGDVNPYTRGLGGYWGRRHKRSAPHCGVQP